MLPGQRYFGLDDPPRETKLIPRLQHGAREVFGDAFFFIIHVVESDDRRILRHGSDDQMSIVVRLGILRRIIVLRVVGVIVLINGRPARIVSVGETAMRDVEFVREDEIVDTSRLLFVVIASRRRRWRGGAGRH